MKKTLLFCLSLLLLTACDDHIQVLFQYPIKGKSPARIDGKYLLPQDESEPGMAILNFEYLGQKQCLITLEAKEKAQALKIDTLYHGQMVRRGSDYFLNQESEEHPGYWKIRSFRLKGDHIYNFTEAVSGSQKEVLFEGNYFSTYEMQQGKTEKDTLYFVQNKVKETIRAFRAMHEKTEDVFQLKKISTYEAQDLWKKELAESSLITVYPNPFSDFLIIERIETEPLSLRLIDLSGKIVAEQEVREEKTEISTENLPQGMYILEVNTASGSTRESIKVSKTN